MHGNLDVAPERVAAMQAVVDRLYAARVRGDLEGILAELTDDAHYSVMGHVSGQPLAPSIQGRAALTSFFRGLLSRWAWSDMAIRHIVLGSDTAVVECSGQMHHIISNQRFHTDVCDVLLFREGRIATVREYCDSFTVVRVAGLAL